MHMVHAEPEWLIHSAGKAIRDLPDLKPEHRLLISNCYSRALMLGDRFGEELQSAAAVSYDRATEVVPEGVLALGEIPASGDQSLEFYNKIL